MFCCKLQCVGNIRILWLCNCVLVIRRNGHCNMPILKLDFFYFCVINFDLVIKRVAIINFSLKIVRSFSECVCAITNYRCMCPRKLQMPVPSQITDACALTNYRWMCPHKLQMAVPSKITDICALINYWCMCPHKLQMLVPSQITDVGALTNNRCWCPNK